MTGRLRQAALAVGLVLAIGAPARAEDAAGGEMKQDAGAATPAVWPVGVILVGASWCSFSQAAAQTLAAAAGPVGLPVLVASADGRAIGPFEQVEDARGHPLAAGVTVFPTVFFVDLERQEVVARIEGFRNPRAFLGRLRAIVAGGEADGAQE